MSLLIATLTLSLVSSCLLLWNSGLVINLVGTHRGIVSHVETLEALDMSHLLLLLNLAHAFVFFLQGAISYMVTLLLALETSDESLLRLKLHLGGLRGFAVLSRCGTSVLGHGTTMSRNCCDLGRLWVSNLPLGIVTFLIKFDACIHY